MTVKNLYQERLKLAMKIVNRQSEAEVRQELIKHLVAEFETKDWYFRDALEAEEADDDE